MNLQLESLVSSLSGELNSEKIVLEIERQVQRQHNPRIRFTLGLSYGSCKSDQCLAFWPDGIPAGQRIGLISSRLGRKLDTQKTWFSVLRTACAKLDAEDILVTSPSTSTARFVDRCAELFGIKRLTINLPRKDTRSLSEWMASALCLTETSDKSINHVYLSPALLEPESDSEKKSEVALRDRAVVALADRVFAIHVRPHGSLYSLLRDRLQNSSFPAASVYVGLGHSLTPPRVADELMELGAIGWHVLTPNINSQVSEASADESFQSTSHAPIIPIPSSESWSFLTHCTRRRDGPWPDQPDDDYLDDLIFDEQSADRSCFAALRRIIEQRQLVASADAIRGGTPIVSFTEVPMADLPKLRTFRPHRRRWDFEPYGICVKRHWLEERHARRVCYGSDKAWNSLSEVDQPFFQLAKTVTRTGTTIDWTVEREWRALGNIDLSELSSDEGVVFVKTETEANTLASISSWPISVLSK